MIHGADYYPEQWLHRPDVLRQDIELMVEAGINTVTLGVFAWSALEPAEGTYQFDWLDEAISRCGEAGIKTILATPSGARPPWMAQRYPEVLRTLKDGRRALYGTRHNHCPQSVVYREKVAAIDELLAANFGNRPEVIIWHISNEYQGTCYCERCAAAFRKWLEREHQGDLDTLNLRWWSEFWSHRYTDWSQIDPPMTHGEESLHGQVIDWKRFVSESIADFARHEIAAIRRHDETTPTTHNFMGLHDSLDYEDLAREIDVVSGDIYPAWGLPPGSNDGMLHVVSDDGDVFGTYAFILAWYRGISARRPWLLMESSPGTTNWHQVGRLKRPGAHVMASVAAIAGGAASIQYFQWRQGRGGFEQFHGSVIKHTGERDRTFLEVRDVSRFIEHIEGESLLSIADSGARTTVVPRALLVVDTPSRWMISQASGPRNDGRRDAVGTAVRHFEAIHAAGYEVDVVSVRRMDGLLTQKARYQLVVLPMTAHIPRDAGVSLHQYVSGGGILLATYFSGVFDRWQRLEEDGAPAHIADVCGVRVVERDQLAAGERVKLALNLQSDPSSATTPHVVHAREYCEILECTDDVQIAASYDGEFYSGTPAITTRSLGTGSAWYLACRLDRDGLTRLYRSIGDAGPGSSPFRELAANLPTGVHWMTRRMGKDQCWLFLFNSGPVRQRVDLPAEVCNRLRGEPVMSRTVVGDESTINLEQWGVWAREYVDDL